MQINDYYICHLLTVKGATNDSLEISNINATFSVSTLIVSKHLYAIVVIKYKFNLILVSPLYIGEVEY